MKGEAMIQRDYKADLKTAHEEISKMEWEIAALKEEVWHLKGAMKADDLRLVTAAEKAGEVDMGCDIPDWLAETVVEQREQIDNLTAKFDCGHRKIDWDDSYGNCVACQLKEYADKYDDQLGLAQQIASLKEAAKMLVNFIPKGWEMPLGYTQIVAQAEEILGPQEPLGEEFQRVLDENRDKLYEDEALRGEEVKNATTKR